MNYTYSSQSYLCCRLSRHYLAHAQQIIGRLHKPSRKLRSPNFLKSGLPEFPTAFTQSKNLLHRLPNPPTDLLPTMRSWDMIFRLRNITTNLRFSYHLSPYNIFVLIHFWVCRTTESKNYRPTSWAINRFRFSVKNGRIKTLIAQFNI